MSYDVVSVEDLYNRLSFVLGEDQPYIKPVDLRDKSAFKTSRILSSVWVDSKSNKAAKQLSSYPSIALLGELPECQKFAESVSGQYRGKIYLLKEGFSVFADRFPFACKPHTEGEESLPIMPSVIVPNFLYMGASSSVNSDSVKLLKIDVLLNVAAEISKKDDNLASTKKIPLVDNVMSDFQKHLKKAISIIDTAKSKKQKILVYCTNGYSRSAAVVIAWLMANNNMDKDQALAYVKQRRPKAQPSMGLWCSLGDVGKKLRSSKN
eukprot:TRINITY_DN3723_c0_g1_i1.p1 TRINITY_DN3723_c0_g1~~TRINITY_DN3723_c0_g1_i1.p1  ORF type:complete len:272 (+),score=41.93 TRINITY_DN3723_c0_g1_i1:23-817(+)